MTTRFNQRRLMLPTKAWIFLLALLSVFAFSFVSMRYRSQKILLKESEAIRTKRHVYVQLPEEQPEIPIVYAQSL